MLLYYDISKTVEATFSKTFDKNGGLEIGLKQLRTGGSRLSFFVRYQNDIGWGEFWGGVIC